MQELYTSAIRGWVGTTEDSMDVDVGDRIDELIDAYDDSGYTFARNLDANYYWSCDTELVNILDTASVVVHRIHQKKVKDWYAANPFELYTIGTKVKVDGIDSVIVKIYKEEARYVCGRNEKEITSKTGRIVNHEDINLIP
jgi:hypothetical protein